MDKNFGSSEIKMYPSSLRDDNADRNAKLNSEQNIISITNRFSDKDSFIISGLRFDGNHTISAGECNIHGYYFKTNDFDNFEPTTDNIYFLIKLNIDEKTGFTQLYPIEDQGIGLDFNSSFIGLRITDTLPSPLTNMYYLLIAQKINGSWITPDSSTLRFTTNVISYNGKELTNSLENLPIDDGEWQ